MDENVEQGLLFTVNDDFPLFNAFLFSIWKVNRTSVYVANASRPNEPQCLYAFVRTAEGKGEITTKDGTIVVTKNSLVLLDVNKIISYRPSEENWVYIWYNFSPKTDIPFFEFNTVYNLPFLSEEQELNFEMEHLMHSYTEINIKITTLIFIELVYYWIKNMQQIENDLFSHYDDINNIVSYINRHLGEKMEIKDFAQKCFLSERQFRCVFKKIVGLSPKAYICRQKLKKAAIMLKNTASSVSSIAYELNYSSPYQFSKEFKSYYSVSPKQYRSTTPD